MKKFAVILACLAAVPAFAEEYFDDYGTYNNSYDEYSSYEYSNPSPNTQRRDNYVGIRIHKNERIAFKYDIHDGGNSTIRKDNWGIGAVVGNRLSDFAKIEFETSYTGAEQTKRSTNYDFDVWANMLNFYLFQEYAGAIAPYAGVGIGFAAIWGDIDAPYGHMSDSVFDLSYQAMIGVNFALNDRIDLNLGVKYQYFGEVEHELDGREFAITDVDSTEFFIGAVYKFGL
ncbi:MAG: porin family protein [Alphaproteobacteria bacterium]|nr:porin family protein [Alphaproteobacteria bacterium]